MISEPNLHRNKRDTSAEDYEEDTNRIWSGALVKTKQRKPRNLCRRKPLYVEFSDIDYDTWIVAPSGYQVNPSTILQNVFEEFPSQGCRLPEH